MHIQISTFHSPENCLAMFSVHFFLFCSFRIAHISIPSLFASLTSGAQGYAKSIFSHFINTSLYRSTSITNNDEPKQKNTHGRIPKEPLCRAIFARFGCCCCVTSVVRSLGLFGPPVLCKQFVNREQAFIWAIFYYFFSPLFFIRSWNMTKHKDRIKLSQK